MGTHCSQGCLYSETTERQGFGLNLVANLRCYIYAAVQCTDSYSYRYLSYSYNPFGSTELSTS